MLEGCKQLSDFMDSVSLTAQQRGSSAQGCPAQKSLLLCHDRRGKGAAPRIPHLGTSEGEVKSLFFFNILEAL